MKDVEPSISSIYTDKWNKMSLEKAVHNNVLYI